MPYNVPRIAEIARATAKAIYAERSGAGYSLLCVVS